MYAITHINRDGMRTLTYANQGRNHCETRAEAERKLAALVGNTDVARLEQVFGNQALGTFDVRAVECYDHGDAKSIYFSDAIMES